MYLGLGFGKSDTDCESDAVTRCYEFHGHRISYNIRAKLTFVCPDFTGNYLCFANLELAVNWTTCRHPNRGWAELSQSVEEINKEHYSIAIKTEGSQYFLSAYGCNIIHLELIDTVQNVGRKGVVEKAKQPNNAPPVERQQWRPNLYTKPLTCK